MTTNKPTVPPESPPHIEAIIESMAAAIRRNAAVLATLDKATVVLNIAAGRVRSVYLEKMRLDCPADDSQAKPARRYSSRNGGRAGGAG